MVRSLVFAMAVLCAAPLTAAAQPPRPPMTPEQQAAAAERRAAEMKAPRPIDALDSVWMEQLTWMEVRDAIAAGKTTALILTGGVESNGPHLATGKHNYVLQVVGESIARTLGNALVAPIVTLEPGRPDAPQVAPGSVFLSRDTYKRVLTDMAMSLRGMGFTEVVLIGDSGGNQGPMKEVAAELTAAHAGGPARFHYIPEYYDYESVQRFIRAKGIQEGIEFGASYGTDGLHEELGIDAIMMVYDPETVRIEQRVKANRATINGVSLLPVEKTVALGKEIVELRANNTVAAIRKALAAPR
ncbi:MAG: creatininase family protein [Vicinamibacterales bacterium]|nr:creatininase family protein [Vicinamibacterales bacterium]